jgi:hypothetical protein
MSGVIATAKVEIELHKLLEMSHLENQPSAFAEWRTVQDLVYFHSDHRQSLQQRAAPSGSRLSLCLIRRHGWFQTETALVAGSS